MAIRSMARMHPRWSTLLQRRESARIEDVVIGLDGARLLYALRRTEAAHGASPAVSRIAMGPVRETAGGLEMAADEPRVDGRVRRDLRSGSVPSPDRAR